VSNFFTFPNPVNDAAARTVAFGVVTMSLLAIWLNQPWILIPLTYGFAARVAAGPKISPLGRFAVSVAAPRLPQLEKYVAGPPKRFAQGVGLLFSLSATIVWLSAGFGAARWVLVPLVAAASLEAFLGFCLGCWMFGYLMKWGVVPEDVCLDCADITRRYAVAAD
jgi:hypothetical protein